MRPSVSSAKSMESRVRLWAACFLRHAPQQFEPRLVVAFLQYAGSDEQEKGPRGERFLDNQKFEGPIIEMVDEAEAHIMGRIATAARIDGLLRTEHSRISAGRDSRSLAQCGRAPCYSGFVRGGQVQVKLFADRLEVHSPGGLFGDVTIETLEERQSTRNRRLMQLLEYPAPGREQGQRHQQHDR